ncbi:MAG: outer membrane lipoprotein chaperone LolA [Gammaproteobacteria bacterium]|jgi:outer membrane lipoprotein carrier protein|nr:outer membrane lipoprotein chaperone LolA [Gammaproteobacteria bacterium]
MKYLMIVLLMLSHPAWADDAGQRLKLALKQMDNLTTDFKQTLLDEDKNIVQQSRGTLALQRPGKFAWHYTHPFEQRIIADGSELWIYDVELDQVTVKPMDQGLANAPIMILMKQADISEQFDVNEVGQRKFLYWVELVPHGSDLEYTHIYIGIDGDQVRAMELQDQFGQSTQIVFENLRLGVVHNPATFRFVPPPGVDVYGVGG